MKKIIILILFSSLIFSACADSDANVDNNKEDPVPVIITSAIRDSIHDTYLGIGEIRSGTVLNVMTGGSGYINDVYVSVGDIVEKGTLLFDLNKSTFQSNLNTTESQLRTKRDNLKLQLNDSQNSYDDKVQLYDVGAISKSELEVLESQISNLKIQVADANTAYNNQVSISKDALIDRQIMSPIKGKIASISIQEEETVQNIIAMQIVDDEIMKVISFVPGEILSVLSVGGQVQVYSDGDRSDMLKAKIIELSQTADSKTGLYEVTSILEEINDHVRNGAYAELDFLTKERGALLIPKKAIVKSGERELVFVVDGDRAKEIEVKVGVSTGYNVEILYGLSIKDQIILEGQSYVKDGSLVMINK
jgi:RND family efflux transporter MFP subunit